MTLPSYDIQSTITRSAHTVLQRAVRRSDGRPVVLKALAQAYPPLAALRQLEFEHRILSKLRLPHVIEVIELAVDDGRPVLVLEDYDAQNLALPAGQRLSLPEFFEVALQAAQALGEIHARGVIHKDIKPQNLLFNWRSRLLKVIDFQLASELVRESHESDGARLVGSLPYMSPEQTGRMNRSLDYRADYYSLGVTFFQLLTGQLPFEANDVMGWVHAHISRPPLEASAVSGTPPLLSRIVSKLMAKDADARYQSARGLIHDLERCRGGSGELFALGARDVSERFVVSERLVGRERELETLLRAFDQASQGRARLLLVRGASGVGKTALIREVHKPMVARQGEFVSGKFDQLERNVPYGAIARAVRQLVRGVLGGSEESLGRWRESLGAALGAGARVLIDWLPELESVLGPRPPAPELNPGEAQHRFQRLFAQLIRVFARPEHPLVMFLDDLQWTDAATPGLLAHLLAGEELEHLLIIAAFRDNEIHEGHLLPLAVRRIREARPDAVFELEVQPLSRESLTALCADSLRQSPEQSAPLAALIHDKTAGNPFFATELLAELHRSGAIQLSPEGGRWRYDLGAAREARARDNVIELMLGRLEGMPAEAVDALSAAACLNNQFELATLARLLERTPADTARLLQAPVARGLLLPIGNDYRLLSEPRSALPSGVEELSVSYRFQHDRVQQACLSLIPKEQRAAVHLRIGRMLQAERGARLEEQVFEVVNHLNEARALLDDPAEREALGRLNRSAGLRAKSSAAFGVASSYLDVAVELDEPGSGAGRADERFQLYAERVECVLMAGDTTRAGVLCQALAAQAPSKVARGAAHLLEARILEAQARFVEAVGAFRAGLALFGVTLPEDPGEIGQRIGAGIGRMQQHLAQIPPERLLELPELEDPELCMAMDLLFHSVPSAIQTCPPLFILAELIMFDMAVEHGLTGASAKNFVDCGIILGGILGDYEAAYRLGRVAFQVLDRFDAKAAAASVHFVFAAYVSSWRAPFREALEAFAECHRLSVETGDVAHMGFGAALRMHRLLHVGHELADCRDELTAAIALTERAKLPSQRTALVLAERALARLTDVSSSAEEIEAGDAAATARVLESQNPQWIYAYAESQMMVSLLLGDLEDAERWRQLAEPLVPSAAGLISVPEYHLGAALLLALRAWPESDEARRAEILAQLRETRDKLAAWSKGCPDNFAHKHQLLSAELWRLEGGGLEAGLALYRQAAEATGGAYIHLRAFALERQAQLWQSRGDALLARALLTEARDLYARWGAHRKVARLAPMLHDPSRDQPLFDMLGGTVSVPLGTSRTIASRSVTSDALDLAAVMKATFAISREVRSEALFASLMTTLLENAAAERGCLISCDDAGGPPAIEADASVTSPPRVGARPLAGAEDLCTSIVQVATRSGEPLVIDDASAHPQFGADAYVRARAVRSVLCLPIVSGGKLVAAFYAENNATAHAFTPARVATLRLIASQAAISIVNARLYDQLESRVAQRTRELADKNREILAMLDAMDQGVFSVDSELCIQPRYSRQLPLILGTDDLAGQPFAPLLFAGSDLGEDARGATELALEVSFGVAPELAALNHAHLVRELSRRDGRGERRELELDWSPITGDRGTIERFLVVVRDVTELRRLHAEQRRNAWEAETIAKILAGGVEEFREFCASSRALLALGQSLGDENPTLGDEEARRLFRTLHTIKGNARSFGFSQLVEDAHAAEALLDRRDPAAPAAIDWAEVLRRVAALDAAFARIEDAAQRRLGSLWAGRSQRLERAIEQIEAALAGAHPAEPGPALATIASTVRNIHAVPIAELLGEVTRGLPSLAAELGKPSPSIESAGVNVWLTPDWARAMRDALSHTLRNSVDHGIEPPAERAAHGKPPRGQIQLLAERRAGGIRLRLSDDGRGLALERLRLTQSGAGSDEALAESIFRQGVSTAQAVSHISGRGVGLDAVRSFVQDRGGQVTLAFTGHEQAGHRPFELIIDLPAGAVID